MKSFGCLLLVFLLVMSACGADNKKTPETARASYTTWYESGVISDVESSSFFYDESDFLTYYPWKAVDGDPLTAWNEGVKGPGMGEKLFVTIGEANQHPVYFDRIEIMPGFYDSRWYSRNNRIKQLRITDGDFSYTATFDDGMNVKTVRFAKPIKSSGLLSLTIQDVYNGDAYDETCISEISIFSGEVKFPLTDEFEAKISQVEAAFGDVKKKFPELSFDSPGGKEFCNVGNMGYGTNEFFYGDGQYVSVGTGEQFSRLFGTWKMDPVKNRVIIRLTKKGKVEGEGDFICSSPWSSVYYPRYTYKEQAINKTEEHDWFEFLYYYLCVEGRMGIDTVTNISTDEEMVLPESWKKESETFIRNSLEEYNRILDVRKD